LFPLRCSNVLHCSILFLVCRRYFIRNDPSPIHPFSKERNAKEILGINSFVLAAVGNFNHMLSSLLNPGLPWEIKWQITMRIIYNAYVSAIVWQRANISLFLSHSACHRQLIKLRFHVK
jgi:hypothetical protein